MTAYLSIGDFSRASHLTVKTLRHYHRIGLLAPAEIDPQTGYRRYSADQLAITQVVRRFRQLGMPLEEIRSVLGTADPRARTERIVAHLDHLQEQLGRTQRAVDELRDLLAPGDSGERVIELRSVPAVSAAAVTEIVDAADSVAWLQGALGELHATVATQGFATTGPAGGLYSDAVFTEHLGEATVFLPCSGAVRAVGRVRPVTIPAAELAVATHRGGPDSVDRTYAALGAHVARHTLGIPGPLREYYLVGLRDTADPAQWRTEVGWPVFLTGTGRG
jgi:DNA-binding transcriptional MerR regulator